MICKQCMQPRRRSFFRDGVCDVCDPTVQPPEYHDPHWSLANVMAVCKHLSIVKTPIEFIIRDTLVAGNYPTLPGADACVEWMRSLAVEPEELLTDEQCKFGLLARTDRVHEHQLETAVAAWRVWSIQPGSMPDPPTGMWLGEPKQRLTVHGCQCTDVRDLGVNAEHPEWGTRHLIKFTSASGHELTWFASEGGTFDPKVGETYDITCTVTKHDEYAGKRSTIVNRCADAHAPKRTRNPKEEQE